MSFQTILLNVFSMDASMLPRCVFKVAQKVIKSGFKGTAFVCPRFKRDR